MQWLVIALVLTVAAGQDEPECPDGFCCNTGCARRTDIPAVAWDCDVFSYDISDMATMFPDCGLLYPWWEEPTDCAVGNSNDCENLGQCAWFLFFREGEYIFETPRETGQLWGDYLCRSALRDEELPTLLPSEWELQGRITHCGRILPGWVRLDDPANMPRLCCNRLAFWESCDLLFPDN